MVYVCKYCGKQNSTPDYLAGRSCSTSPTGKHVIMSEKTVYICKYCGKQNSTPDYLAGRSCSTSPTGYHELME